MTNSNKQIEFITKNILSSKHIDEEQYSISLLNEFYVNVHSEAKENKDTYLQKGIALSQKHAADCIKDYKRTIRFIQGVYQAILSAQKKFPHQRLNILYAGCGPYAPLIIPLLHYFKPEQVNVTLIDIHQHSIDSVKEVISILGYEDYFSDVMVADATTYTFDSDHTLHMVITETMFRALVNEPQVAITQNLAPQLDKDGILVPEEISLSIGYSFFSKEPYLNHYKDTYDIKNDSNEVYRKQIKPLFSINKKNSVNPETDFTYSSPWLSVPDIYEQTPDICIYTTVKIFDAIQLKNEDSLITNPHCVGSLYNFEQHTQFKVQYCTQRIPKWDIPLTK